MARKPPPPNSIKPLLSLDGTRKTCRMCGEGHPLDADHFCRMADNPTGFDVYCKPCRRELTRNSELRRRAKLNGEPLPPRPEVKIPGRPRGETLKEVTHSTVVRNLATPKRVVNLSDNVPLEPLDPNVPRTRWIGDMCPYKKDWRHKTH
jgi:hypothetical protein